LRDGFVRDGLAADFDGVSVEEDSSLGGGGVGSAGFSFLEGFGFFFLGMLLRGCKKGMKLSNALRLVRGEQLD